MKITKADEGSIVMSGFDIGGETAIAEAGSLVESPSGIPHGIRNLGPGPLRLLAIKNGKSGH